MVPETVPLENLLSMSSNKSKFLSQEECSELKQYNRDKMKSHGYEIGVYPNLEKRGYPGLIHRYYDPPSKTIHPHRLKKLDDLAKLAIDNYNKKEGTCYLFNKVLKAMTKPATGVPVVGNIYYITFEAYLPDEEKVGTFQAEVHEKFPCPKFPCPSPTTEIVVVRKIKVVRMIKKKVLKLVPSVNHPGRYVVSSGNYTMMFVSDGKWIPLQRTRNP